VSLQDQGSVVVIARRRLGDKWFCRKLQAGDHVEAFPGRWGIVTRVDEGRGQITVRLASAEKPPFFRPIWPEWEVARKFENLAIRLDHPDMKTPECEPGA
jgi:hypothetical protein